MEEKLNWIVEYLKQHFVVDVLNTDFVDAYITEFNPKHRITYWGANKVPELGKVLACGVKHGFLIKKRVGLSDGAWRPGLPKWVYCYQISKLRKSA